MPARTRARLARLGALAAISVPMVAGVLLLIPGRALADDSPSTIECAASGTSGVCGTYDQSEQVAVTARVSCTTLLGLPQCSGNPTFVVTSPTGGTLSSQSLGAGRQGSLTYTLPADSPDGTYAATLTGGGADVSASFVLAPPPASGPTVTPSTTSQGTGPTTSPTNGPSTPAGSTSAPTASSSAPATAGTAPSSGSGHTAVGGGHQSVADFPSFRPPVGIATLPPLAPSAKATGEPGVVGPYGTTLPYDGSVTVAQKTDKPTVLSHVADTFDDRQVVESVAAACLALLFAAHLRRFSRRPSGDADL